MRTRGCLVALAAALAVGVLSGGAFADSLEDPVLQSPETGATITSEDYFSVTIQESPWVRIQYATSNDFSVETVVCDTDWFYPDGYTEWSWTLLDSPIWSSNGGCSIEPAAGTYYWRVSTAIEDPSGEPGSVTTSEIRSFRYVPSMTEWPVSPHRDAVVSKQLSSQSASPLYDDGVVQAGSAVSGPNSEAEKHRVLLRFDLSDLAAEAVERATLVLREAECENNSGAEITLLRITEEWDPSVTMWSNQPSTDEVIGALEPGECGAWVTIDITDAVRNWASGAWENFGVQLQGDESTSGSDRHFLSASSEIPPYLVINEEPSLPDDAQRVEEAEAVECIEDPNGGDPLEDQIDWGVQSDEGPTAFRSTTAQVGCSSTMSRWVKVVQLHVSKAMRGRITFHEGRDTRTQVAVHVEGQGWSVGAMRLEAQSRSIANSFPKAGPFRRIIGAKYLYKMYSWVNWCVDDLGWYLCTVKEWRPDSWVGDLQPLKQEIGTATMAPYRYRIYLSKDELFSRREGSNHTFTRGAEIGPLGLDSRAGYSTKTVLSWRGLAGCRERILFGKNVAPPVAKVVYAKSNHCG